MSDVPTGTPILIEVPKKDLPQPEFANFFYFSFSGPELELLVGFLDTNAILRQSGIVGTPEPGAIKPEVSHRIVMSARGFAVLREQVQNIGDQWDKAIAPKESVG
jgi:hypothetical protein